MRKLLDPRLERGEVRIEDIELDHKCRDDLSAILIGIQYLYSQEDLRERLFACGKACKDDPPGGKSASGLTHLVWLQKLLFVVQRWKGKRG